MKDVGRLCHGFWGDGCPGIYLPYSSFLFFTVHFNYNDLSFFAKVIVKIKMKVAPYFVAHNAPHCTMNITCKLAVCSLPTVTMSLLLYNSNIPFSLESILSDPETRITFIFARCRPTQPHCRYWHCCMAAPLLCRPIGN